MICSGMTMKLPALTRWRYQAGRWLTTADASLMSMSAPLAHSAANRSPCVAPPRPTRKAGLTSPTPSPNPSRPTSWPLLGSRRHSTTQRKSSARCMVSRTRLSTSPSRKGLAANAARKSTRPRESAARGASCSARGSIKVLSCGTWVPMGKVASSSRRAGAPAATCRPMALASCESCARDSSVADTIFRGDTPKAGPYRSAATRRAAACASPSLLSSAAAMALAPRPNQRRRSTPAGTAWAGTSPSGTRRAFCRVSGRPQALATPRPRSSRPMPNTRRAATSRVAAVSLRATCWRICTASSGK